MLALELGDRRHAEELLTLADRLPNVLRFDEPTTVQEASRHLLKKVRQK